MKLTKPQLNDLINNIGGLDQWAQRCHECSLALIRTKLLPKEARVARGWCDGVGSQHSWVVIGNPYDEHAPILDGTLWSYTNEDPELKLYSEGSERHVPHGSGHIWDHGIPDAPTTEIIELESPLSDEANQFLKLIAPDGLDFKGWWFLSHAPVGGWPSDEIIGAILADDRLRALVPIDIAGMMTDTNPGELYW